MGEQGGVWMKTGDEVTFKESPNGHGHIFVIDRIKEIIMVKPQQSWKPIYWRVLTCRTVQDCAVIAVPEDRHGEDLRAFIVKSPLASSGLGGAEMQHLFHEYAKQRKISHTWLMGGIEFLQVVPKIPSGKTLRRFLRESKPGNGKLRE
ncbi:hypothetical protein NCS52_00289700 [Fusarium sp. LHS14.1]|nr:hypothetical protein NCS52_00289700 [Fusarium sp. LHS14.1]